MKPELEAIFARIRAQRGDRAIPEPLYKCRCKDTGMLEFTGGDHVTAGSDARGGTSVTASEARPVYRRCPVCNPVREGSDQRGRRRTFDAT